MPVAAALAMLLCAAPPAVVNGKPITEPEVAKALRERIRKSYFHRNLEEEQVRIIRREVLEALITEELRAQEAVRRGLRIPMEPVHRVAAAEEANAGGSGPFEAVLAANGIDRARYLEVMERPALAERTAEAELSDRLRPVTRDEALSRFRRDPARYRVAGAVRARETCVRVDPSAPGEEWERAERRAAEVRSRLAAGADFAALARELACDGLAGKGGELGLVHPGSIDPAMERALWALRDGELSAPVRTIRGWHVLQREGSEAGRAVAFEEVETAIRAELREERKAEILQRLDADLRSRARVVLQDGP